MTLLNELQKADKTGQMFKRTPTAISHPTGFLTLDYRNGFMLTAKNELEEVLKRQPIMGIVSGSFNMVIGKSAAAKTTLAIQIAFNIIQQYASSFVIHCDIEAATNYQRIRSVTGAKNKDLNNRYILKQDGVYIEDIHKSIMTVAQAKRNSGDKYRTNTGILDEFGEEIIQYEPTVFIIDSIPSLALKNTEGETDMQSDTYATRKAKKLAEFHRTLTPIMRETNIIVIHINHIQDKIEMNAFAKTQAQTMYLKMTESLPGGNSPIYYSTNIFKNVTKTKYKAEDDGFDGFLVNCELVKSRTNKAGQITPLIYDQAQGFDNYRTLLHFAEEMKLVSGRNPYRYFVKYPELKFSSKKFREEVVTNPKLRFALYDTIMPLLEQMLSVGREDEALDDSAFIDEVLSRYSDEEIAGVGEGAAEKNREILEAMLAS